MFSCEAHCCTFTRAMENCGEGMLIQRHLSQIVSLHNLFLLCYEHCGIMIIMTLTIMYVKWYLLFSHLVMSNSETPMDYSRSGLPVPRHLLESAQGHVHCFGDTIQPSHSLLLPSIFLSIRSFPMSQLLPSGGQIIGAPISASVLPMSIQGWFPSRLTGLISLHHSSKANSVVLCAMPSLRSSSHNHTWPLGRSKLGCTGPWLHFASKVMSLLFNTLSRFVRAFLPRSNRLLISWLQSPSAMVLEPKQQKSVTASTFSPLFAMNWWGWMLWS